MVASQYSSRAAATGFLLLSVPSAVATGVLVANRKRTRSLLLQVATHLNMDKNPGIREQLSDDWIPLIYIEKVRSQRTRSVELKVPERENTPEILHTLLGIELKVKKNRFACPDLATARYLRVFARLGCSHVAIPYDITKISVVADQLEEAWQKLLLVLKENVKKKLPPAKKRVRVKLISEVRSEIAKIGAGELMPEFKQSTKQRKT